MQILTSTSIILLLLFCPTLAFAKNFALQMGGNCETEYQRTGEQNIFLNSMSDVRNKLSQNWEVTTLYDEQTDFLKNKIKHLKDPNTVKPSGKAAFYKELDRLIEETSKSGEDNQVLIWMDAHGTPGKICVGEGDQLSYLDHEFTDRLEKLKKNAKLGFVNEACFSGSSIPALGKYGCAVAAQSARYFSFGAPISNSLDPKKTANLSTLYLSALSASTPYTSPQLSSFPEGQNFADAYMSNVPAKIGLDPSIYLYGTCKLTPSNALDAFNLQNITEAVSKETISKLEPYFGKSLPEYSKLQNDFNEAYDPKYKIEFENIAQKIKQEYMSENITMRVLLPSENWYHSPLRDPTFFQKHPQYEVAKTNAIVAAAQLKATELSGMESGTHDQMKVNGADAEGMGFSPNFKIVADARKFSQANWKSHIDLYLKVLRDELNTHGINADDVVDSKDASYQTLVDDAAKLEMHEAALYNASEDRVTTMNQRLEEIGGKLTSPHRLVELNQMLGYRYEQEKLKQTGDTLEQQKACDNFKLFK
jgi:hypothetical protein